MASHYTLSTPKRSGIAGLLMVFFLGLFAVLLLTAGCVSSSSTTQVTPEKKTAETAGTRNQHAEEEIILLEDFEMAPLWVAVKGSWNDNDSSLDAVQTPQHATSGARALECRYALNGINGAAFYVEELEKKNWNGIDGLYADMYNAAKEEVEVAVAVCSGPDWVWQETAVRKLKPGQNLNVRYNFTDKTMKSAATGWVNKASLKNAGEIRRLIFKLFGTKGIKSSLFLDNIRLIKTKGATTTTQPEAEEDKVVIEQPSLEEETKAYTGMCEVKVTQDSLQNGRIAAFEKLELTLELKAAYKNPFDPEEITVQAEFVSPGKRKMVVPGFFMLPYNREINGTQESYVQSGEGSWKVRFTPYQTGTWTYRVQALQKDKQYSTETVTFTVDKSSRDGFVRIHPRNSRYFAFDSGRTFLPIGMNVAWYDSRGMLAYEKWFAEMSANGANYARIWMASWGFGIEWLNTGLGNYYNRQRQACQLDLLFELAEKHGIYLMLNLINHGQFSTGADAEWGSNPYNAANGGPCARPVDFLSDPLAKKYFKQRLRYLVARWGWSTNLFSWEWWNEVNLTAGLDNPELLVPWMSEMKACLNTLEPYHRLVSNSTTVAFYGDEDIWTKSGVDYLQVHMYNQNNWGRYLERTVQKIRPNSQKPLLFGEIGLQGKIIDPDGINFQDGLWTGLMTGSAGSGMLWWWDTYIEPLNLYYHFKGISNFIRDELAAITDMNPFYIRNPEGEESTYEFFMLASKTRKLLWVRSKEYNYDKFLDQGFIKGIDKVEFPVVRKPTPAVPELPAGKYTVEVWDPATGKMLSQKTVSTDASGKVELPEFDKAIAVKIY